MQASKTLIFSYLWYLLLFSNAFFKTQVWNFKKLRNIYVPKYICQHSSGQVIAIVTDKIHWVLHINFECLFWPIKCMHSKPRFWYTLAITLLFTCLLYGSNLAESRGIYPQVVWQHSSSSAQFAVWDNENRGFFLNLVYEL